MLMPWISGAPLYFLRPWWLLGLLVLPAWWWWQRRHRQQDNVWRSVVDLSLIHI